MKSIEQYKVEITLKILAGEELTPNYINTLSKDDELRTFMCSLKPCYAYFYAYTVDKEPRDDTREAVCKDPASAYCYAESVDKGPRDDTREAAYKDPIFKNYYVKRFGE